MSVSSCSSNRNVSLYQVLLLVTGSRFKSSADTSNNVEHVWVMSLPYPYPNP